MENKVSEKKPLDGSMIIKLQAKEDIITSEIIVDHKVRLNSSSEITNKGMNNREHEEDQRDLMTTSSTTGKNLASFIKQENLALNGVESPTKPSATETSTAIPPIIKNDDLDEKLKYSAKLAEIGEVREENERLKLLLARILKDYQSLQSKFVDILRHQEVNDHKEENKLVKPKDDHHKECDDNRDRLLVSLSLGRADNEPRKSVEKKISSENNNEGFDNKLALGLGSSLTTSNSSPDCDRKIKDRRDCENPEATEIWPPSKVLKRSNGGDDNEDGASQMLPLKKARVSVRTRCDTPTMNDGCQWRKYGQKISKGNPCPRAYYRCTISPTCPVRKQVQRCVDDMSILITTYEGTHNHPLPVAATAMASTTAAAASMLQSRSTTSATSSSPVINNPIPNNNFKNPSTISLPSSQFYLPNTTISTCNSHPTVTLDLTLPNPNTSFAYPATSLAFSSPSSSSSSSSYYSYNNSYNIGYNFNNYGNNNVMAHHARSSNYNPYSNIGSYLQPYSNDQQSLLMSESIVAATKAITANPKFQSALAAVLTSFVGSGGGGGGDGDGNNGNANGV